MNRKPICEECGSDRVGRVAFQRWSMTAQCWIDETGMREYCLECGRESCDECRRDGESSLTFTDLMWVDATERAS
ncbi:MAG TPA: hypothetical protein VF869_05540 [Jatrophihabitantaceae bacterium]